MAHKLKDLDTGSVVGDMHEHGRIANYLDDRIEGYELDHVQQFSIYGSSAFAILIMDLVRRRTGKDLLYMNKMLVLLEDTCDGNLMCAYSYDEVYAGLVIFRPIRPDAKLADPAASHEEVAPTDTLISMDSDEQEVMPHLFKVLEDPLVLAPTMTQKMLQAAQESGIEIVCNPVQTQKTTEGKYKYVYYSCQWIVLQQQKSGNTRLFQSLGLFQWKEKDFIAMCWALPGKGIRSEAGIRAAFKPLELCMLWLQENRPDCPAVRVPRRPWEHHNRRPKPEWWGVDRIVPYDITDEQQPLFVSEED